MNTALLAETGTYFRVMSEAPRANETDHVVIRAALNRWAGPVQRLDIEGKKRELADREELMTALLRLYALSRASIPKGIAPVIRAVDVERVLSCFRRLSLMGGATPSAIVDYCERAAADDDNHAAYRADPLMLRYVLTFHQAQTQVWFAANDEARLVYVCERADLAGIRAWFERVSANKEEMPKDCCQYLRLMLLRLWNRRMGDMETLAFEQAVLEVRLFETMGWENTRMFCALLRRIGGGNLPAFGAYLSSEDIEEALVLHESLSDSEQCTHFRALATVHDRRLLGELERAVFANAAHFDTAAIAASAAQEVAPVEAQPSPAPKASRLRRLFGFKPEVA
ncbi:MAG: hypothetical protein QM760_20075 [Nibricoccus sp.]